MKKDILADIIGLLKILKKALKEENTKNNKWFLYKCYESLDIAIREGYGFTRGNFTANINSSEYQETQAFLTPEMKWVYFAREDLKEFDDALSKFMRNISYVYFKKNYSYKKIINAYRNGWFGGYERISIDNSCRNLEYRYIPFDKSFPKMPPSIKYRQEFCNTITINIDSNKARNKLIKKFNNKLDKLNEFKIYLGKYIVKNITIKDLL